MICGYGVAMIGGSFSPSTFLVLNNSHLSPGIVLILQPVVAYTLQRNSSSGETLTGNDPLNSFHSRISVPRVLKQSTAK